MNNDIESKYPQKCSDDKLSKQKKYTIEEALVELDELKNIALNCFDKNGNPNISVALRAIDCKAKIAGLYSQKNVETKNVIKMSEIIVDGQQLKLNIGEEYNL